MAESKSRRKHDRAFKIRAVKMVIEEKKPLEEVANIFAVNKLLLHRWKKEYLNKGSNAFLRKEKRIYSRNFKIATVKLITEGKLPPEEVAHNLGITNSTLLHKWKKECFSKRDKDKNSLISEHRKNNQRLITFINKKILELNKQRENLEKNLDILMRKSE